MPLWHKNDLFVVWPLFFDNEDLTKYEQVLHYTIPMYLRTFTAFLLFDVKLKVHLRKKNVTIFVAPLGCTHLFFASAKAVMAQLASNLI